MISSSNLAGFEDLHVGVTGTSSTVTRDQIQALWELLTTLPIRRLHHGDCVEADAIAHAIFKMERDGPVTVHPPLNDSYRAFCGNRDDQILNPKDYLARDRDVAFEADVLIALPKSAKEQRRGSGTWATVRYALEYGTVVVLILPDGTVVWDYKPEKNESR